MKKKNKREFAHSNSLHRNTLKVKVLNNSIFKIQQSVVFMLFFFNVTNLTCISSIVLLKRQKCKPGLMHGAIQLQRSVYFPTVCLLFYSVYYVWCWPYVNIKKYSLIVSRQCWLWLTLPVAAVAQLCTGVVILLQCLLEVENAKVMFSHCKVNAAQIVPEHTANTFTWVR